MRKLKKLVFILFISSLLGYCSSSQKILGEKSTKLFHEVDRISKSLDIVFSLKYMSKDSFRKIENMIKNYKIGETGTVSVIDIDGNYLIKNDFAAPMLKNNDEILNIILNGNNGVFIFENKENDRTKIVGFKHLVKSEYIVISIIDENDRWFEK